MAGVKTQKSSAGHKSAPRRPKDYVAPAKVIDLTHLGGAIPTERILPKLPTTDAEKAAVTAYDAAVKALQQCKPGDNAAEAKLSVSYQRLVQLGLRRQLRGKRR